MTTDSSDQLSVTWDAPTPSCPADVYQVEYVATRDDCSTAITDPSITLPWQQPYSVTLVDLKPYTTYGVTVTPAIRDASDLTVIDEGISQVESEVTAESGRRYSVGLVANYD